MYDTSKAGPTGVFQARQSGSLASPRALEHCPATMPTITWHGHACFLLEHEGKRVVIDPFFTGN